MLAISLPANDDATDSGAFNATGFSPVFVETNVVVGETSAWSDAPEKYRYAPTASIATIIAPMKYFCLLIFTG